MRRTAARQGVRMLKFVDVFGRWEASELSQLEAAELLGMGERTFRRWSRRYEEEGEAGLLDRRIGKASGKRVPVDRCEEVEPLYRTRYRGFTARHFHEHLVRDHRFAWSYSWTKTLLQSRNLLAKAPRRGAHRRKRPRRPLPGMMLHQDASRHAWLARHRGSISLLRWTMRRVRSTRRCWWRKKARPRRSGPCWRCLSPRPAAEPLYRSRQPLFSHRRGGRQGGSRPADAGWPCAVASGR